MSSSIKASCIIAIDIGTTAIKFVVFDKELNELHLSEKNLVTYRDKKDYSEQDVDEILSFIKSELKYIAEKFSNPIALSFSAAMHSILAVDKKGKSLTKAIIWSDLRSKLEASKLRKSEIGQKIYRETGTPIHPMSPLCKLLWWQKNEPSLFDEAYKFLSIKEYVIYHLTNQFVIDYGMASATGLFMPTEKKWNPDALALANLQLTHFSSIVSPKKRLKIKKEVALSLKLPEDIAVFSGSSDGCLANLGDYATEKGVYAISIGTSGAVRACSKNFETDASMRLFSYMLDDDVFVHGGAVNNGGNVLAWLGKFLNDENPVLPEDIMKWGKEIPLGADGLIFLPYLQGERAPFWNPEKQGSLVGLTHLHTKKHMARAVLEGVMFNICFVMHTVANIHPPPKLIKASGGFTKSGYWVQMLADIAQCPVQVGDGMTSAAKGAAIMALEGLSLPIPRETSQRLTKIFSPEISKSQTYQEIYQRFTNLITESNSI